MVIELVGLPGTGKSTFARELGKAEESTLITVRGTKEILWLNFIRAIMHPVRYTRLLVFTLSRLGARELWYEKFVNLFLVANAKYQKARRYPMAIIDQGYLQNYLSLFEHSESHEEYLRALPLFLGADVAVLFDIPETERQARLTKRGYGVRERMPPGYRLEFEKVMQSGAAFLRTLWSRTLPQELPSALPALLSITSDDDARKVSAALHGSRGNLDAIIFANTPSPVIFVINARMPTERAHGIQIVRTAEALIHAGVPAKLWVPTRRNHIHQSVEEFYGTSVQIPLKKSWCLDLFTRVPPALAHRLISTTFAFSVLFGSIDRKARYITRNPEIVLALALRGANVWYEAHTAPRKYIWLFRLFLHGAKGIIANSDGTGEAMRKIRFQRVTTIRNGVDLERFTLGESKEDLRKELGLPVQPMIVTYVGGFYEWKGVGTLLDAWREPALRDHVLVIVGGTESEIARLGKADMFSDRKERIIVLPHQPSAIIPKYLRAADVLVLPNAPVSEESVSHTSPIKLFEYLASERPVIASDLPSIREIVDEKSVVFFKAGDPRSLGGAIVRTLDRGNDLKVLVANARNIVQNYSWSMRAKRLLEVFSV